ncbi:hypothetical protein NDU88_005537 [Pleurodeles waltl]|uniref:Uncharacterized protein n=1 Tax=Pleurodeles waltl TaxID=8319 RepID=A0AAV7VMX1_PLEWA|nr:hypothetical protein NDU88_005537 [Pleurodeles waltl]
MEVPRPPVYYSPKHSVVSRCEGRAGRRRSRGESKGKKQTSSKQQVRRYPRGVELRGGFSGCKWRGLTGLLGDVVLSRRSQPLGFTQAALTPQRDPRRGESKGKPAATSKSDGIPGERSSKVLHKRLSRRSGTRKVEENPKANQQQTAISLVRCNLLFLSKNNPEASCFPLNDGDFSCDDLYSELGVED